MAENKINLKRKRIYLIRHAESINNVAKLDASNAWCNLKRFESLPSVTQLQSLFSLCTIPMNSDLSGDGIRMVQSLRNKMIESQFVVEHGIELIVHSHLIRAVKTCQILFEDTGIL